VFPPRITVSWYRLPWKSTAFASYRSMITSSSIVAVVLATRHPRIAELNFLLPLPVWVWFVTWTPPPGYRSVVVSLSESFYVENVRNRLEVIDANRLEWLRKRNRRPSLSVPCFFSFLGAHSGVASTHSCDQEFQVLSAKLFRLISSLLLLYGKGIFCTLVFFLHLAHGICVLMSPLLI